MTYTIIDVSTSNDEKVPGVFNVMWELFVSTYGKKAERHPQKYERWNTIRSTMKDILMAWCSRLSNIHTKPPAIARLSMLLWFYRCPSTIWSILSHLRIALSENTTKKLYTAATQIPLSARQDWEDHGTVAMIGADNMSYSTINALVRLNNTGNLQRYLDIIFSYLMFILIKFTYTWLDTVNAWHRYTNPLLFPKFGKNDKLFIHITDLVQLYPHVLVSEQTLLAAMTSAYNHVRIIMAQERSLLAPPVSDAPAPAMQIEFLEPLFNIKTSAYADIGRMINAYSVKFLSMKSNLILFIINDMNSEWRLQSYNFVW